MSTQPTVVDKSEFRFVPQGERDPIALSVAIVRKNFCRPTKSGVEPSDQDVMAFLVTCRSQQLNPFLGDVWLTGYDSQGGAQFSILVSQRVLLKRAESHEHFDGIESGITVEKDGVLVDLQTEILLDGQNLVGAWCRVYRKDRSRPTYKQIPINGYRKDTRFWKENPAGMIVKCAESDAIRFAFPTSNGGLRTVEEGHVIDIGAASAQMSTAHVKALPPAPAHVIAQVSENPATTPQRELESLLVGNGHSIDDLKRWGDETGNIKDAGSIGLWDEIPATTATRLLRSKTGLLQALASVKGGVQ